MAAPTAPSRGIVTPEAVLLEFAEAGLGSRSLGFLVDLAVRATILYATVLVLGTAGFVLDETLVVVVLTALGFSLLLVYPIVFETIWNGRTPGKMLLGLRVVTIEGAPIRFRHAAVRAGLGIVDFLVGAGSVAIVSALLTRRSQRLGDLAAGTIVIRDRQAAPPSRAVLFQPFPGWEPFATALDVSALDDDAYALVRSYLLRLRELRPAARAARGAELRDAVSRTIGVELPAGTDVEGFLVAVASAYQRRSGDAVAATPGPPAPVTGSYPGGDVADEPADTWGAVAPPP